MTKRKFTKEEIKIIAQNPYVLRVSSGKIIYTLEFKRFALEQAKRGLSSIQIFKIAGFDTEVLGKQRMYDALRYFKKQAATPEGLRPPKGLSTEEKMAAFAKEDYSRKHTKIAIRELQKKVVHLEQQIEFLKKIQSLDP